ncbi:TPA: hypothetical protein EYO57_18900, partial [Candidatus Poribacteria bacterium]|nr:hypothetical protein [Candidatus Poribacteria bacterium]
MHANHELITKESHRWGVSVPEGEYRDPRKRALALVKGIKALPVQRLMDRRQHVANRDARELRARTDTEAREAGRVEGRARNVHGATAPTRSRGALSEVVADLPPEESESSVHNPAAGTRTSAPTPAAPVDVHGRAARPVPSSGPPPLPSPAYEEEPLSPANEARRRRDMAAASPLRHARDDVRFETTEMAALESAGDTPDPFGGATPDSFGGATPADDYSSLLPPVESDDYDPEQGSTGITAHASLSRSRSTGRSRSSSAPSPDETDVEGEETDTTVVDLRDLPDPAPLPVHDFPRPEPEVQIIPRPTVIDLAGDTTDAESDVPESRKRRRSSEGSEEMESRLEAKRHRTESPDVSGVFTPPRHEPGPQPDQIVAVAGETSRQETARIERERAQAAQDLVTRADTPGGSRRSTRARTRPPQIGDTGDPDRPADYTGRTEGLSGALVASDVTESESESGGPQLDWGDRMSTPHGRLIFHPNEDIQHDSKRFAYQLRDGRHSWANQHGVWTKEGIDHKFISAVDMRRRGFVWNSVDRHWTQRASFQEVAPPRASLSS